MTARRIAGREAGSPGRQRWASRNRRASRASTGTIRVASAAVSAERNESAAERAQQLVRVDRGGVQREAGDHDQRAQAEDRAVGRRLERHVDRAERRHVADPRDHGQPVAHDERVDQRDQQRERQPPQQRARDHVADARAGAGQQHREQHRAEHERVLEGQRHAGQHHAVERADPGARGVQRARPAAVGHGLAVLRPSAAAAAARGRSRPRPRSGRAAASRSARPPRRRRPTSSVPVTTQVGCWSRWLVAATSPEPAPSVRTASPRASSSSKRSPSAVGRAKTPESFGPCSRRRDGRVAADVGPAADEHPQHRGARLGAERRRGRRPSRPTPRAGVRDLARRRAARRRRTRSAPAAACPSARTRTAPGYEPTTAGMRIAAPQSWWSHHTRSPAVTLPRGGAAVRLDAVDVEEPVDRAAAAAPAADAVDRLHEAAAVARLDLEASAAAGA